LLQITSAETEVFHVIDRQDLSIVEDTGSYIMGVFMRVDDTSKKYQRSVMSFSRMFEKIGGLYTVVFSLGLIWKALFQQKML